MKNTLLLSALFIASCFSQLVLATEKTETSEHFKYSVNLKTSENQGLHKIRIPHDIQSKLQRIDAKDLQVIDSKGNVVPTFAKHIGGTETAEIIFPLHYFPIPEEKELNAIDSNAMKFSYVDGKIEMFVNKDNNIAQQNPQLKTQQKITGLIFKNPLMEESDVPENIANTYLRELIIETSENFEGSSKIELKTSNDLNTWSNLSAPQQIVNMNYLGQELKKDRIKIPTSTSRFIMLTWKDQNMPEIISIAGVFNENPSPPPYEWFELKDLIKQKNPDNEKPGNVFEFTLSPALHSNAFRMSGIAPSEIFSGVLKPYLKDSSNHLREQYPFTFYSIPNGEELFHNNETGFSSNTSENWTITFDYPIEDMKASQLSLAFNLLPLDLYFLATANAPYRLEFSRKNGSTQPIKLEQTIRSLLSDANASISDAEIDGLIVENKFEEPSKINWKKILLWSVLVFGMFLMLFMARDLFRKLNTDQPE